MTRSLPLCALLALSACDPSGVTLSTAGVGATTTGGVREYLVFGSSMSFEECRARGGLIIRDKGSPMVACDPAVVRAPPPENEFDHPADPGVEAATNRAGPGN